MQIDLTSDRLTEIYDCPKSQDLLDCSTQKSGQNHGSYSKLACKISTLTIILGTLIINPLSYYVHVSACVCANSHVIREWQFTNFSWVVSTDLCRNRTFHGSLEGTNRIRLLVNKMLRFYIRSYLSNSDPKYQQDIGFGT